MNLPPAIDLDPARLPITVIINATSGSDDKQAARRAIQEALQAHAGDVRLMVARRPREVEWMAKQAAEEGKRRPIIVAAAGGDGTVASVANALLGTDLPLGVIPLGTFNYFARELRIPLAPEAAAAVLRSGQIRRVDVARIDGRVFLNNASLGLYRRLIEQREQHKQRFGRNRAIAVVSGLVALLRNHRVYDVQLDVDGRPMVLRTMMLFFGNNRLQLENLGLELGERPGPSGIALLALRPVRRHELIMLALRGALQGLRDTANLKCYRAAKIEVRWRGGSTIKAAVDGEVIRCRVPLRVEALPDALPVVVPAQPCARQ